MRAPTAAEMLIDPTVLRALEQAWTDSLPAEPTRRHEEGGWVYMDPVTGRLSVRRAPAGTQAVLDMSAPPILAGSVIVGTFHTHPNPTSEGWYPGPSVEDTQSAWFLGVPCLIRADDGIYTTGPDSRRGGLHGAPGYPSSGYPS